MTRQYPRLDRWAARSQERLDRQRREGAQSRPETRGQRLVVATLGITGMVFKAIALAFLVAGIVGLAIDRTARSFLLAFVLLVVVVLSSYTSLYLIRVRREEGRHWLTGLKPRALSELAED